VLVALGALGAAGLAEASRRPVWERVAGATKYQKEMALGDQLAIRAADQVTLGHDPRANQLALRAVEAYERAAKIRPRAAEPHYRAAEVLYGHFIRANRNPPGKPTQRAIRHWDEFQRKAPRDPRLADAIFNRSFTLTKIGGEEMYRRAIADYATELSLIDAATAPPRRMASLMTNKAEIHMAIGELEQAIEHYYRAVEYNPQEPAYAYGLAVALDRDGQAAKAREVVASHKYEHRILFPPPGEGEVFFIPEGDVYWYQSLGYESLGQYESAAKYMERYLSAQPKSPYAARARESLKVLERKARSEKTEKKKAQKKRAKGDPAGVMFNPWIIEP
jgi:tetratricopeptide (TPR) repeat protein